MVKPLKSRIIANGRLRSHEVATLQLFVTQTTKLRSFEFIYIDVKAPLLQTYIFAPLRKYLLGRHLGRRLTILL